VRQPVLAVAALLFAVLPATAAAAPPNDNYLSSTTINQSNGALPAEFHDVQDTSTATTQADLFNPDRNGQPFGGAGPETTTCGSTVFGKTVWYDFMPPTPGGVEIQTAGFDNVVTVYRWNPQTSMITQDLGCHNDSAGTTEDVLLQRQIKAHAEYTIQVGGVNAAGGPLDFKFTFFPDTDGDGVLDDAPDHCRRQKGIAADAGCPPTLSVVPSINYNRLGSAVKITSLTVAHVVKRGVVQVSCGHCGRAVKARARRSGTLTVRGFVGRTVRRGDFVQVSAMQKPFGRGRYRFGAVGRSFRWPVTASGLGRRTDRCLAPGSLRKRQRCP
jgi:hypothetical protein